MPPVLPFRPAKLEPLVTPGGCCHRDSDTLLSTDHILPRTCPLSTFIHLTTTGGLPTGLTVAATMSLEVVIIHMGAASDATGLNA
jgi:hypothetical protein